MQGSQSLWNINQGGFMSKFISYLLVAFVAFFIGVVSAASLSDIDTSAVSKISAYIHAAHSQDQAY